MLRSMVNHALRRLRLRADPLSTGVLVCLKGFEADAEVPRDVPDVRP